MADWPVGAPAGAFIKHCPYPECGWSAGFTIFQPPQFVEEKIAEHLDGSHPGWTWERLQELAQQRLELEMQALDIEAQDGIGPDWDLDEWWRTHGQDPEAAE